MKKLLLLSLVLATLFISGCGMQKTTAQTPKKTETSTQHYSSKELSVEFPNGYSAEEKEGMVIVSSVNGKIIIGGFKPSVGHPEADEKNITFKQIAYSKDPKTDEGAVPAALYYRAGDTKTEAELFEILKSVKRMQ